MDETTPQKSTKAPGVFGRIGDGAGFVLDVMRARPVARRLLSGVSVLMAVIGVGMLAYPFYTNFVQDRLQTKLAIEFKKPETKIAYQAGKIELKDPLTRLSIPAIDLKPVVVVQGTTESALKAGAGHYENTPLPGEEGNVGIAGHRTTFGKPFANIDRLKVGDEIFLETPIGRHVYRVMAPSFDATPAAAGSAAFVVPNTDWTVISQSPGKMLTLTSCHPKGSSKQRIVVRAELVPVAA